MKNITLGWGKGDKMSFQTALFFPHESLTSQESSQTECAGVPQCVRHRSTALLTMASVLSWGICKRSGQGAWSEHSIQTVLFKIKILNFQFRFYLLIRKKTKLESHLPVLSSHHPSVTQHITSRFRTNSFHFQNAAGISHFTHPWHQAWLTLPIPDHKLI